MHILRTLNFDAGVLCEWDHDRQSHNQHKPVSVRVDITSPKVHEVSSQHDEAAEQIPEQHHLVSAHTRHQACEHGVVVGFGHDPVDQGREHAGHGGAHGEEQVPDLQCDGEHRHRGRAGHGSQQEVRHVVVHQVEDLVKEDPKAEHRDGLEHRPFQALESEAHAERACGIPDVHQQQHAGDGQLRAGDADRPHAKPEQKHRQERLRDGGEQLSGLLEHELLVRHDVGVEWRGQQLDGDVDGHDAHQYAGQDQFVGGQTTGKEAPHIDGQRHAANQTQQRHHDVNQQEHAVEPADAQLIALRLLAHVETHVRPVESGAQ